MLRPPSCPGLIRFPIIDKAAVCLDDPYDSSPWGIESDGVSI